jgi:hypothetical protein
LFCSSRSHASSASQLPYLRKRSFSPISAYSGELSRKNQSICSSSINGSNESLAFNILNGTAELTALDGSITMRSLPLTIIFTSIGQLCAKQAKSSNQGSSSCFTLNNHALSAIAFHKFFAFHAAR